MLPTVIQSAVNAYSSAINYSSSAWQTLKNQAAEFLGLSEQSSQATFSNEIIAGDLNFALVLAQSKLTQFANSSTFNADLITAFGNELNSQLASTLRQKWLANDFSNLPTIKVVPAIQVGGSNGAFTISGEIYLSEDFLTQNANNANVIVSVLLEEIGHWVDTQINQFDAPGDEGEIFALLAQGLSLTTQQLDTIRNENDVVALSLEHPETFDPNTIDNFWKAIATFSPETWEALGTYSDEAWIAMRSWDQTGWTAVSKWTPENWKASERWTPSQWQGTAQFTANDWSKASTTTSGTTANFAENGTGIAYTVTATDAEGTTLTYALLNSDTDASLFNINSTTGAINFKTAPDFETPLDNGADNTYNLTVTASHGSLTSSKAVAITVTDLNEIKGNPLINNGRNPIVGTVGPDYLTGGAGAKTLTGGGGNDSFVFTDMRDVGQRIADFTVGQDKLVFTQLFSSLGYTGSNPIADGYIKFVQETGANSAHTFLQIDRDGLTGSAIARNFLQVDNTTPALLNNINNFQF